MKRQQKPTEAQAEIIRRAGLDPDTVTVASKSAAIPLAISYHGDGNPLAYWVCNGGRLSDTKPTTTKPKAGTGCEQGQAEPATNFDFAHLYASNEGVDADAVAHTATRAEIEARLQGLGFSKTERAVVLAWICDRLHKQAEIARETKLNRKTVAKLLKLGRVKDALRLLGRGELPAPKAQPTPAKPEGWPPTPKPYTLRDCDQWARDDFRQRAFAPHPPPDWKASPLAESLVRHLREYPAALLGDQRLAAALVDLLEAAKLGDSARRVAGVVPEGKPKVVRAAARKALAELPRGTHGDARRYSEIGLHVMIFNYAHRIAELQRQCKAPRSDAAARAEEIREAHPQEVADYPPKELQGLLTTNPLEAAIARAEKVTGIGDEVFRRAWQSNPDREADEAELNPARREK